MSRLSKIHIVILIVVFLVHCIQAADDNEIQSRLCQNLIKRRNTAAKRAKEAQDDKSCLTHVDIHHLAQTLKARQVYVPKHSPLTLGQLSHDPDPERSGEWLTYVMVYNDYQYEICKTLRVKISNTLRADAPRHGLLGTNRRKSLATHSKTLAGMMKRYSSMRDKYAFALEVAALNFQTVPATQAARGKNIRLRCLSDTIRKLRRTVAKRTKNARHGKLFLRKDQVTSLAQTLQERRTYVPSKSPLSLVELSQDPDPRSSREHLTYVMEYNAHQYECCEVLCFRISNTLRADAPRHRLLGTNRRMSLATHSQTLAGMMKRYLFLEVKYAVALGVVAPHIQSVLTTQDDKGDGSERATAANELRDERVYLANLIDSIKVNKMSVSLDDATDDSVLRWKYSPLSPQELAMAPTSHMSVARLHYVMEYNALMFDKYRFKSAQLTKVLDDVPMSPELRHGLENQQEQVRAMMEIYLGIAYKYAKKLVETAVHPRFGFEEVLPPSSPSVGNESCNSKGHVPVASSELGEPEDALGFEVDLDPEDWNAVLQLLEESEKSSVSSPSCQAHSSQ
ncbi:hypothetical protein SeLEV6574_g08289, partial [Synchytrium endobioticum]